jgi:hypothetical protein
MGRRYGYRRELRALSLELRGASSWLVAKGSWLVLAFICSTTVQAQRSPFNGLEVLPADSTGHYRILIGGHFHGESTNRSGYPASTLLANLDTINALGANLFLSTGDLFMDPVKDMPRYQRSLFSKLKMPLFNAPGNHDRTTSRVRPEMHSGIKLNADHILILDLEGTDGALDSGGMARLKRYFYGTESTFLPLHVFIISHRPIWAEDDPQYSSLFEGNTRSLTGTNFKKEVYPLLEKIAEHAHVYWISGSMGGFAPSSIFFQQHAKNITYIQCAIRDEPRDALLIADVSPDTVIWSALSLTGQKLLAPEKYDAAWWREHLKNHKPGFNWRLLPYLIKTTVLRREFWWGMLGGALALMLLRRLLWR